ncbi:HBR125Wp [Eremothecium sinecaudum]|uniref:Sister chromatid cohesion protein n=1 Tax=Eremothecium sinecaudum TaxID=45286 RepID=A0A125RDZ9_9SACH|nr:HBR125Wp [Eremothecium sinecaudum]AMD19026.1 HBR125Wp [Eremothecium sinecaudum]
MSTFPGEDTTIPKRLSESLEHQPLNHLIPKNGLLNIISSPISVSLKLDVPDAFEPIPEDIWKYPHPIDFDPLRTGEKKEINFRRPGDLECNDANRPEGDNLIFANLKPLAINCLASAKKVGSDSIVEENNYTSVKRKLEMLNSNVEMIDTCKKSKLLPSSSPVTINQVSLGNQYLKNLSKIMEQIGYDDSSANFGDYEYWVSLDHGNIHILSKQCLEKLHIIFNSILTIPAIWDDLDVITLQRIMDVCVNSALISKEHMELNDDSNNFQIIAFSSSIIILMIFMIDKNDRRLHVEQYMVVPVDFLGFIVENLSAEYEKGPKAFENTLSLLHSTLTLIPAYISKRPTLDDGFITKLVYMVTDLALSNWSHNIGPLSLQNQMEHVKAICSKTIEIIFEKLPDQRMFIVDELLSHLDDLPATRSQKRMKNVGKGTYITHFSYIMLSVLQVWNSYDYCAMMETTAQENLKDLDAKHIATHIDLEVAIEHVIEVILKKTFSNTSKYRAVLGHLVSDLIVTLLLPTWPITDIILAQLLKKLLAVFNPQNQKPINIESIVLHELGNIGSAILDIRLQARQEEDNNLIKLFNYPDQIKTLLNAYDKCVLYCKRTQKDGKSVKFLWSKQLTALNNLRAFDKDSESWNSKLDQHLSSIIKAIHSCSIESQELSDLSEIVPIYCCTLFASPLVGMYEPYLKLVLSLLDRQKAKLRSGAIRCLSLLITKDPSLLLTPIVKDTIQCRLRDSSPLVKDAILELLDLGANYIQFYQNINANYNDDSVLVRKHVLKINQRIYDETIDINIKSYVGNRILRRIEDEEDAVIENARSELLKRWVLSIQELEERPEVQISRSRETIKVIAKILSSGEKPAELVEQYLSFYILNKRSHTVEEYEIILKCLSVLTDQIIELAIELQSGDSEEENSEEGRGIMKLLSIFSSCDELLITKDHITSLYPYLHDDHRSDFQLNILRVYKTTFKKMSNFKPKFLFDLETTILSRLPKMSVKELEEAMPLVWSIAKNRKDDSRICKACASCLGQLTPYISKVTSEPSSLQPDGKIQRLLYLATGFARFCSFENTEDRFPNLKSRENIFEYVTKCLLMFTKSGVHHVLRRISIKNLVKIASQYPKLFNSRHVLNVLDGEFENGALDIQLVMLETLYDFFLMEEKKSMKQAGVNGTVSSNEELKKVGVYTNRRESIYEGICSALVSRYLDKILKICLITDLSNALVAIRFLKLITNYGYTNPSRCIPTVIALLASPNKYMKNLATELLQELFQAYERMVFNGLIQGIKLGTEYARKTRPTDYYIDSGFFLRIQEILSTSKKNKTTFLKLVRKTLLHNVSIDQILANGDSFDTLFLINNIFNIVFEYQFELYALVGSLDAISEQIRDSIAERISNQNIEHTDISKISKLIFARLCMEELRRRVFDKYNLSESRLALIGNSEEDDLKHRTAQVVDGNMVTLKSEPIFLGFKNPFNNLDYCKKYINSKEFENM